MSYCGKSQMLEWGKIESSYKILVFSRTLRRILLRILPMKDETLLIVIMKEFFILLISFWNIIPNKVDAFLLGHGVCPKLFLTYIQFGLVLPCYMYLTYGLMGYKVGYYF